MSKEKFILDENYKNISEIGNNNFNEEKINNGILLVQQKMEQYNLKLLEKLIAEFGEKEGRKQFELMQLEANERWEQYKRMDSSNEYIDVKKNKRR